MTLNEFITQIKTDIKNIESIYKGFTITELSLPNINKNIQQEYFNAYYVDAINGNQSIKLLIPTSVFVKAKQDGYTINENVSVDIVIDSISLDRKSTMLVKISKIIESGISEQELFVKNLTKYCNDNNLLNRIKKPLPSLIKKIALISTTNTNTLDDIITNLSFAKDTISYKVNNTSEEIAEQINLCQNKDFDLILLYRGGHEDKSMNIYSDIPVLNAIHNSSVHVGVALGHEIDNPFVYNIADSTYSTPTNFAQKVNEYNLSKLNQFNSIIDRLSNHFNKDSLANRLNSTISISMEKINHSCSNVISNKTQIINNSYLASCNVVDKLKHTVELECENLFGNINTNTSSMINNLDSNLQLNNQKINSSIDKLLVLNNTALNNSQNKIDSIVSNQINSTSIVLDNISLKIYDSFNASMNNVYNQLDSSYLKVNANMNNLLDKMQNDLYSTNNNIHNTIVKLEYMHNNKKQKRVQLMLVILLVIILAALLYFVVGYK